MATFIRLHEIAGATEPQLICVNVDLVRTIKARDPSGQESGSWLSFGDNDRIAVRQSVTEIMALVPAGQQATNVISNT
jgi:hypothetical protein